MKHFTLILSLLLLSLTSATAQSSRATVNAEDYPFVITTNPEKPVLYYIYSGRDGGGSASDFVFVNEIPYGESDYKLQLMYKNPNKVELTQLWYFMEENGKIKIISAADNRMITVANTADGAQKVYTQTAEDRTHAYYTWILDKTGGYYAFKTSDGKTFLSHNGNWATGKSRMGLYNADGSKDEGSRVFFEAYNDVSGIKNAMPEREFKYGIFTITGKRIDKITGPGIYIVNGKKRVVR
ncbi:MAG: hypothetical protein IKT82_04085 [Bacteroidaceae bacterium]|nr:hypothetical protein [Bacteroidaceae bacterium]